MRRSIALTAAATVALASVALATWHSEVFAGVQRGSSQSHNPPSKGRTPPHGNPRPPAAEPSIADGIATFQRTAKLGAVAKACAATATADRPGAVVLRRGLEDAHVSVTIAVPCAIQLAGAGPLTLRDVRVSSRTLNIADNAFGAGQNTVVLTDTRFTGSSDSGLLITLTDPADRVVLVGGLLRYPAGIAVQTRGDRSAVDNGGTVLIGHTTLSARGTDSTGIAVTASTKHGVIAGDQPKLDAESISFVAEKCAVTQGRRVIDCRASHLAADLKRQAQTK
jgi:hypothetical protein